jgi:hypothetical protein
MAKKTAIEDLINQLESVLIKQDPKEPSFGIVKVTLQVAIDFAKIRLNLEKYQITQAYDAGFIHAHTLSISGVDTHKNDSLITSEQYYNATYRKEQVSLTQDHIDN